MAYVVRLTTKAEKQLASLPRQVQKRVGRCIDQLAADPRCAEARKPQGFDSLYRIHASKDHVLVYGIQDAKVVVHVLRIAGRDEVYENLAALEIRLARVITSNEREKRNR